MLIISSFVFISCTVDSKQRYQVSAAYFDSAFVLDTHTGKIVKCVEKDTVIRCTEE